MFLRIIFFSSLFLFTRLLELYENDDCVSSLTNGPGVCREPSDCAEFQKNMKRINVCSFIGKTPIICCPTTGTSDVKTKRKSEISEASI